jgi:hypothetical protein
MDERTVNEYKDMVAESKDTMESKIKAHLVENCPKFEESKFGGCMEYLVKIAREILGGKNGEVPDEVCYRICRDYFDDEIWREEEEEKSKKEAAETEDEDSSPTTYTPAAREKTEAEKIAEKHKELIRKANENLGIQIAKPIDLFAGAV